jgi:tetratricopeptide (TPR) repeat protein
MAFAVLTVASASAATASQGLPKLDQQIDLTTAQWGQSRAGQYLAGMQAQRLRDPAAAAKYLESALGHDPNNLRLVRHVFYLMVSEGQFADARQHARMLLRHEPGSFIPVMTLAVSAMQAGDYAEALDQLAALDGGGHNGLMRALGQAWAAVGAGDLVAARAALKFPVPAPGWDSIRPVHEALIEDVGKGEPAPAYAALAAQAGNLPTRLQALITNFEERQKDPSIPPVITNASQGLALAFGTIASALVRADQERTAMIYTRLGLGLSPDDDSLLLLLADALQAEERFADAAKAYGTVPRSSDFYYAAQIAKARNLALDNRLDEGITLLEQLSAEFSEESNAPMQLGDLMRRDERYKEAAAAYDMAFDRIELAGEEPDWQLYYTRGIARERIGRWPEAEADFKNALAIQEEQPLVLNYLGYSWIDRGENLEEATAMVRRAAELRPDDGFIADSVGWAAYRTGNMEEAVRELERAILIEPLDPTINEHLGDIYWLVGRKIEARYQWDRALSFDPEEERIPGLKERLACTDEVCAPLEADGRPGAQ